MEESAVSSITFAPQRTEIRSGNALQRRSVRVLVAEDHPVNLLVLQHQLAGFGMTVLTASNGREALDHYERGGLDLVFCDCHMPVMDGYEFSRRVREHEKRNGLARLPIIGYTGSMGDEDSAPCLQAGMDAVLNKPAGSSQLRKTLSEWLSIVVDAPVSPASAAVDSLPVIDVHALVPPGSGDAALTLRLLERFRLTLAKDSSQILQALELGDRPLIARWAHRMKGASLMIGARRLAGVCRMLEHLDGRSALASLRDAFVVELARLEVELERELVRAQRLAQTH